MEEQLDSVAVAGLLLDCRPDQSWEMVELVFVEIDAKSNCKAVVVLQLGEFGLQQDYKQTTEVEKQVAEQTVVVQAFEKERQGIDHFQVVVEPTKSAVGVRMPIVQVGSFVKSKLKPVEGVGQKQSWKY